MKTRIKLAVAAMIVLASAASIRWAGAQEGSSEQSAAQSTYGIVQKEYTKADREFDEKLKALDQQRQLLERESDALGKQNEMLQQVLATQMLAKEAALVQNGAAAGRYGFSFSGSRGPFESNAAIRQATEAIRNAKDDRIRKEATSRLREALEQYFEDDMKVRVKELESVAARLAKLQQQLDRRRAKQDEIIDLQIKIALNEADGLGFFGQPANPLGGLAIPAPMPVPMTSVPPVLPTPPAPPAQAAPVRVVPGDEDLFGTQEASSDELPVVPQDSR